MRPNVPFILASKKKNALCNKVSFLSLAWWTFQSWQSPHQIYSDVFCRAWVVGFTLAIIFNKTALSAAMKVESSSPDVPLSS